MVTVEQLKDRFKEFERIDDPVIQESIDQAARRVDPEMYRHRTDDAVLWLACHLAALSPHGKQARTGEERMNGKTIYLAEFRRLQLIVGSGHRVI